MCDRTFTNNGLEPSDLLKQFIEELVEEIVLNGASFDNYKKSLRRYCEHEHFDGEGLIGNLTEFFDTMEELKSSASKAAVKLAYLQARECYISASMVDKLVDGLAKGRTKKADEEVGHGSADGHDYVDLGLPSGTLWATCNIGASKPEDYGDYFAWGETEPQSGNVDNWNSYKYANGSYDKLTKYCSKSDYGDNGFTDNQTTLQTGDDPATSWGSGWRTPSKAQWDELLANTTNKWTTQNGVKGRLFTAKNGQTLFLPAAGYLWGSELRYAGSGGYYWSRSLDTDNPSDAWGLTFNSGGCYMNRHGDRRYGFSVRPVRQN